MASGKKESKLMSTIIISLIFFAILGYKIYGDTSDWFSGDAAGWGYGARIQGLMDPDNNPGTSSFFTQGAGGGMHGYGVTWGDNGFADFMDDLANSLCIATIDCLVSEICFGLVINSDDDFAAGGNVVVSTDPETGVTSLVAHIEGERGQPFVVTNYSASPPTTKTYYPYKLTLLVRDIEDGEDMSVDVSLYSAAGWETRTYTIEDGEMLSWGGSSQVIFRNTKLYTKMKLTFHPSIQYSYGIDTWTQDISSIENDFAEVGQSSDLVPGSDTEAGPDTSGGAATGGSWSD